MSHGLVVPAHLKDDPEVQRELAELEQIFEQNPLEAYNHPDLPKRHEKQLEFHSVQAPPLGIKALIAANRSGKTVTCVVDDIIQLVDDRLVPEHLKAFKKWHEPVTIWVGAPKGGTHEANSLPLFRKFLPKAAMMEGSFSKSFRKQPVPILTLSNGSMVVFKTYDQDLDAWASAEVHRIHWDEEPNISNSRELRSEARARLISTEGDEIIGMTPLIGFSWVHDDVLENRDDPGVSVFHMRMEDNPWNTPEAIAKFAEGLTEEEKRMRLNGEFVSLGGLFFPEFREDLHVVDSLEKGEEKGDGSRQTAPHLIGQEIVITIDPGYRRFAVTWQGFDKENAAIVFDEICPSRAEVSQVADEIKRRNREWGITDATYVIDPSARNRSPIDGDDVEAAFSREEIYCQRGQNSRGAGILEMKRRLQDKPIPSLLFCRNCAETIKQTRRYARDPKSKDEWAALPQTETVRWDCVDTVRYGDMSRVWYGPDEPEPERTAFQPGVQMPYAQEQQLYVNETPPMGAFS